MSGVAGNAGGRGWMGEMAHHPSKLHETICPFTNDHAHVGTADEVLDQLCVCYCEWEAKVKRMTE